MKTSWIVSFKNDTYTKYYHNFFCQCNHTKRFVTDINQKDSPYYKCSKCGNEQFINTQDFDISGGIGDFFEIFHWNTVKTETVSCWKVEYYYEIPRYFPTINSFKFEKKVFLSVAMYKLGINLFHKTVDNKFDYRKFNFNKDLLYKFFHKEPIEILYQLIMSNIPTSLKWLQNTHIDSYDIEERLHIIDFFLQHSHLKEIEFFHWDLSLYMTKITVKYPTQLEMIHFIVNKRQEKIIKKIFYSQYERALNEEKKYNPTFDYIVSQTIDNVDLVIQLYKIKSKYKNRIFFDEEKGIAFINFLKYYYTQKQIVKLLTLLTNEKLPLWLDTCRMLSFGFIQTSLRKYFTKVKLSVKNLHDEVIRVTFLDHLLIENKEEFKYTDEELNRCSTVDTLMFKLPKTVEELNLWSKILHNCMFGYADMIHKKNL